ncbi:unnamed protein product [Arctia plantaginis]|uniref:Uncharacterized protein n=1 Tax=Arctia plantaginis TaxID=874455 RepID=A0A8S0YU45_ARCPL|nr:unnamed protein product [Arctia plantaginis]
MSAGKVIFEDVEKRFDNFYNNEHQPKIWYPMFSNTTLKHDHTYDWVIDNQEKFLKNSPNEIMYHRWFFSESGAITAIQYSPHGNYVIVGHSSGLIEVPTPVPFYKHCSVTSNPKLTEGRKANYTDIAM